MKIIGPASPADLPTGLVDILNGNVTDYGYCMVCDGFRATHHECYCILCGERFPNTDTHACWEKEPTP